MDNCSESFEITSGKYSIINLFFFFNLDIMRANCGTTIATGLQLIPFSLPLWLRFLHERVMNIFLGLYCCLLPSLFSIKNLGIYTFIIF